MKTARRRVIRGERAKAAVVWLLINARSFSASAATLRWRFARIALPNKL
jgi:hypothetical protein